MKVIVGCGYGCLVVYEYTAENVYKIADIHREELELEQEERPEYFEKMCKPLLDKTSTKRWMDTINSAIDYSSYRPYEVVEVEK